MKRSKKTKVLVIILAIAMLLPTILVTSIAFTDKGQKTAIAEQENQNIKTAEEISNMTGVTIEEILKLKNEGKTWNEILDKLKKTDIDLQSEQDKRQKLLSGNEIESDYIQKLKDEDFEDEAIAQTKMVVDRVVFQLNEILSKDDNSIKLPSVEVKEENLEKEDLSKYRELSEKINISKAVFLMLKLEKDFGSMDRVLDEYLYSLQIEVDLEIYLTDKDEYEKEKNEKSISFDIQKLITIAVIESKMLEKIQNDNMQNQIGVENKPMENMNENNSFGVKPNDLLPDPMKDVNNVRPEDPLDDVMKEINDLKNKSLN